MFFYLSRGYGRRTIQIVREHACGFDIALGLEVTDDLIPTDSKFLYYFSKRSDGFISKKGKSLLPHQIDSEI